MPSRHGALTAEFNLCIGTILNCETVVKQCIGCNLIFDSLKMPLFKKRDKSEIPPTDNVSQRGKSTKEYPSYLGRTVFAGMRLLDPVLQYSLISYGYGNAISKIFGLKAIHTTLTKPLGLLVGLTTVAALRHVLWASYIVAVPVSAGEGVAIGIFNLLVDSINTLIALRVPGTQLKLVHYLATGLYALGAWIETWSELQRKWFKDKSSHQGHIHTGGLFSLARHINYGGYTIWRGAAGIATGSIWGIWTGLFFSYDFAYRGVPALDNYMSKKYKDQWESYKKFTPYKLFPGIY